MEAKLGQDPAFPELDYDSGQMYYQKNGMSKRFYAACAVMQGLLSGIYSNKETINSITELSERYSIESCDYIVGMAYEYADELLKQENQ